MQKTGDLLHTDSRFIQWNHWEQSGRAQDESSTIKAPPPLQSQVDVLTNISLNCPLTVQPAKGSSESPSVITVHSQQEAQRSSADCFALSLASQATYRLPSLLLEVVGAACSLKGSLQTLLRAEKWSHYLCKMVNKVFLIYILIPVNILLWSC